MREGRGKCPPMSCASKGSCIYKNQLLCVETNRISNSSGAALVACCCCNGSARTTHSTTPRALSLCAVRLPRTALPVVALCSCCSRYNSLGGIGCSVGASRSLPRPPFGPFDRTLSAPPPPRATTSLSPTAHGPPTMPTQEQVAPSPPSLSIYLFAPLPHMALCVGR